MSTLANQFPLFPTRVDERRARLAEHRKNAAALRAKIVPRLVSDPDLLRGVQVRDVMAVYHASYSVAKRAIDDARAQAFGGAQ